MAYTSEDLVWHIAEIAACTAILGLMTVFKVVAVPLFLQFSIFAAIATAALIGIYACFGEDNKRSFTFKY